MTSVSLRFLKDFAVCNYGSLPVNKTKVSFSFARKHHTEWLSMAMWFQRKKMFEYHGIVYA